MRLWLPLLFVFLAVTGGTLTLLSAAISAFETRRRRLQELRAGRPVQPVVTKSTKQEKADVDPAPLLSGLLQQSAMGKKLQLSILQAGLVWRPSEFIVLMLTCAIIGYMFGFFVGGRSIAIAIMMGLGGSAVPYGYIAYQQSKRQSRLSAQIPDMLDILSASLRAGHSFLSGIQIVVSQMRPPISEEFARVVQEVKFGAALNKALEDLIHRTQNYDMELIIQAVQTQLSVGGNLAEILDKISTMIRDRVRLKGEIDAATAEGRFSAMILVGMPFLLAFIVNSISPGYLAPLFIEPMGRLMLGGAVGLLVVGILIIRSMLNIDM